MLNRENGHLCGDEDGKEVHTAAAETKGLRAGLSESETGQLEALLIRLRDNVS